MLECEDGTLSGADGKPWAASADDIFAYVYVYSSSTDVCTAGVDVNDSCTKNSEQAWTECKRAQAEYKRAQTEYK
jgi:hypothetical protein